MDRNCSRRLSCFPITAFPDSNRSSQAGSLSRHTVLSRTPNGDHRLRGSAYGYLQRQDCPSATQDPDMLARLDRELDVPYLIPKPRGSEHEI